jgi:hypothetical protein
LARRSPLAVALCRDGGDDRHQIDEQVLVLVLVLVLRQVHHRQVHHRQVHHADTPTLHLKQGCREANPRRVSRSGCSTTMRATLLFMSVSSARSLGRLSVTPEAISLSTC